MTPVNQEVKAVLQEVLQEAMEPVLAELYTLNRCVENIEKTMATKEELESVRRSTQEELEAIRQSMATKEELEAFRQSTQEELEAIRQSMATKEELEAIRQSMATKEELEAIRQSMATKEELEAIRQSMATKEDIADLPFIKQAVIELSDKVNLVIDRQDRQEKIIELLSARSIRHEAEISELRCMIQS
jgi:cysteinyl-tRNA synthetase